MEFSWNFNEVSWGFPWNLDEFGIGFTWIRGMILDSQSWWSKHGKPGRTANLHWGWYTHPSHEFLTWGLGDFGIFWVNPTWKYSLEQTWNRLTGRINMKFWGDWPMSQGVLPPSPHIGWRFIPWRKSTSQSTKARDGWFLECSLMKDHWSREAKIWVCLKIG